jgi:putative membrane protein
MFHRLFLWALLGVNALSIFGYATFSRHSELLVQYPWAQPIFENAYWVFARLQILLALLSMVSLLQSKVNKKWVPAFFTAIAISLASELSGTTWGLPFGSYEYTDLLGPTILGRVPYLIPLSWFFMGIASYGLAHAVFSSPRVSFLRVLLASWILVSWDLTLDPAMSHLAPFWTWNEPGPYYGTPLLNLVGWYFTGLVIMLGFELIRVRAWIDQIPFRNLFFFYAANLLLPVGIVVAAGLWEAIGITVLCYGVVGLLFLWRKFFWAPRSVATHLNVK